MTATLSRPVPSQVLGQAQSGREFVQDFCPLAQSLEWEFGQQNLRERGNKAFISDASPVPFVINNDGSLSRQAAEVFFANLAAAEKTGTLERDVFVLELGIGVGLFARFFLDAVRERCLQHRKGFYDRLTYVAADKSERMLTDVLRHGVLANHPGKVCRAELWSQSLPNWGCRDSGHERAQFPNCREVWRRGARLGGPAIGGGYSRGVPEVFALA